MIKDKAFRGNSLISKYKAGKYSLKNKESRFRQQCHFR